jgi:hypothetical protein
MYGSSQKENDRPGQDQRPLVVGTPVEVLNLDTIEAVPNGYLLTVKDILRKTPTDKLDASIKAAAGLPYDRSLSDKAIEAYLYPQHPDFHPMPSEARLLSANPFGLAIPRGLRHLDA